MGLISRWLGIDDLIQVLKAEHQASQTMIRDVLAVSAAQVDVTARMTAALQAIQDVYQVDGPPEGRPHYSDLIEAEQWERDHESES